MGNLHKPVPERKSQSGFKWDKRWWGFWDAVASAGPYAVCTSLQADDHTNSPSVNFYRPNGLPDAQPTVSEHWRQPATSLTSGTIMHHRGNQRSTTVNQPQVVVDLVAYLLSKYGGTYVIGQPQPEFGYGYRTWLWWPVCRDSTMAYGFLKSYSAVRAISHGKFCWWQKLKLHLFISTF